MRITFKKRKYGFERTENTMKRWMALWLLLLIMLPMWINFLLRTYAWMAILDNNGLLNRLFQQIGLISAYNAVFGTEIEFFSMLNTPRAHPVVTLWLQHPLFTDIAGNIFNSHELSHFKW